MSEYAIGIDLGTSTSVVSVLKEAKALSIPDPITKTPIVPSVVGLNRRGEFLAGQRALDQVADPNQLVREAKREMGTDTTFVLGGKELRAEEVGGLVLRKMKDVAEGYLGSPVPRAVITVPAYFTDIERRATLNAAQLAGIEVIRLINEPTAAAMAFGINNLELDELLLVFDMGGGTLDVTILEMIAGVLDVKASDGDKRLGGKDIDTKIMEWAEAIFKKQHPEAQFAREGLEGLKRSAEAAKKELSEQERVDLLVQNFATEEGAPVDLDLPLSRADLDELIGEIVDRALRCINTTLAKAGVKKDAIGRVLLVGGSTYVPRIREAVLSYIGRPEVKGVDPDLAVSQGAAISAGLALGQVDEARSVLLQDASTYGMGVLVVEDVGHQEMLVYSELMPPGASVPFMRKQMYSLRRPDQATMEMEVVLDSTGRAKLPQDTIPTAAVGLVTDIPQALYGRPHDVEVTFSYDQNHIVQVQATILGTGKSCTIQLNSRPELLDERTVANSIDKVDSLWSASPIAQRHTNIIRRAETVLAARPERAEMIEAALVDLKTQIAKNDADAAQAARERLTDLLTEI